MKEQPVFKDLLDEICKIASEITEGFPIRFAGVDEKVTGDNEDNNGFYPKIQTIDGPVPLNTLSQGTQSIIQWLARLIIGYARYYDYPRDLAEHPALLIIDEIDAHLQPSWQRRIIPALVHNFPNMQIFCSTHSPLMVAGLRAGQVQLLQRDGDGRVTVYPNEEDITGWTADEILRHYLGVLDPTDLQTVEHLKELQDLRHRRNLSSAENARLEELRRTVHQDLHSGPMASQLEHFGEVLRQVDADSPPASSDM